MLRSEIIANSQKIKFLAELLGMGDRFDQALLEHQTQQDVGNRQQQQRRQALRTGVHWRLWSQPK